MASEGPTTVGSINATLHLNADDFERGMNRAGEQADRLDGRRINLDVHAATEEAAAKLRELELAENRLRIAQLNQEEVSARAGATEQQRLRAQNALITAEDRYDRALAAREQAVRDATEAERAATAVEDGASSATERHTESINKNNEAQKAQFSWMQVLLAAAPYLFASTTELAAAATGMATSLTLMGLAGVAAVKGIKDEMQQGTNAGEEYASGLTVLKGDLDALEHTAAVHMLESFNVAITDINTRMPFLNQIIGEMGSELGQIGGGLLSDVLLGLQRMQPLIEAGATALGDFVGWLGHFTDSDGFSQFVAYSVQNLPQVIHFLESVVTLAGNLIAAFAPLGPVVTGALDGLVSLLNSFPLPVLAGITTTALTIAPAFNIAKAAVALFGTEVAGATGTVTLFGVASNLAIPIVGILVAALAGLTVGIMSAANSQQAAIPTAQAYADALARDGDAVGDYTRQLAAKNLAEAGAYDSAKQLGISQEQVTAAVTQGGTAYDALISHLRSMAQETAQASGAHGVAAKQVEAHSRAIESLIAQVEGQHNAITGEITHLGQEQAAYAGSTAAAQQKAQADAEAANRLGVTTQAYQAATDAQDKAAQKTRDTTLAMQLQNNAAGLLKQAWDNLNGKTLSAAEAQNAFDSSLANMGTHVTAAGKQITFTTNSIHDMSAASVALRGQLIGQVNNLEKVIEANGGLENATESARAKYAQMRQQIIDNAVAHGVERAAAEEYINTLFQIPTSVKTDAELKGDAAIAEAARVQMAIDAIHDKTVSIILHTINTGAGESAPGTGGGVPTMTPQAYGGPVQYRAGGGGLSPWYARGTDTVPTVLTPGEFVVKAGSAKSVGAGALEYINRHGQLPPQQGGGGPVYLTAVFQNPFTGEQVQGTVRAVARQEIGAAVRDAAATRPGLY